MMFRNVNYVCCLLVFEYLAAMSATREMPSDSGKVTVIINPRRLQIYETPVRITLRYPAMIEQQNISRLIRIRILDQNSKEVENLNKSVESFKNNHTLKIPCEIFSYPGKYHIQYFVQGITKSFKQLRKKISVRGGREKVRLDVPQNHTALSKTLLVWITKKQTRCKPYKDKLQLFWINSVNKPVLVTTKKINDKRMSKRTQVKYGCNIFDTEGIFYFKYISGHNGRTLARSKNISITWGNYKLNAQSKSIFPCSTSFAIKFTTPYCEKTEDTVQVRSKLYNNVIALQSAYPGFRSVFFTCGVFKRHIREYCFYYITKSSLTNTETIQTKICLPSLKTELSGWSDWSNWGLCSSPDDCGLGRKYRLRSCRSSGIYGDSEKSACHGSPMQQSSCTLPPCQASTCHCGCILTDPGGTIISPEWSPSFVPRNKSKCHWWIKVEPNKKVKLWFDKLILANYSTVHIIDGNDSNSKILQKINKRKEHFVGDIFGSSNIISIRYYIKGNFNKTTSGFLLSYSSIDKTTTNFNGPTGSPSKRKHIVKMTFIGALVVLIVVMIAIFFGVMCKIQRQPRDPPSQSKLGKRVCSSHTSTVCMSDSTLKSFYEPPISGDESGNNNLCYPRVTNSHRPRVSGPIRMNNRACVHLCPKCCDNPEGSSFEYYDTNQMEGRPKIYASSHYRVNNDTRREPKRHIYQTTRSDDSEDYSDYL